jgi:hypothetical protein
MIMIRKYSCYETGGSKSRGVFEAPLDNFEDDCIPGYYTVQSGRN